MFIHLFNRDLYSFRFYIRQSVTNHGDKGEKKNGLSPKLKELNTSKGNSNHLQMSIVVGKSVKEVLGE